MYVKYIGNQHNEGWSWEPIDWSDSYHYTSKSPLGIFYKYVTDDYHVSYFLIAQEDGTDQLMATVFFPVDKCKPNAEIDTPATYGEEETPFKLVCNIDGNAITNTTIWPNYTDKRRGLKMDYGNGYKFHFYPPYNFIDKSKQARALQGLQ
ncbi:hypothetical protein [Shewanella sp. KT0246]|uniref:hypothetical protein n=1 Tax=Shewanella sp. KT0246 TaxID=2815912 RepID=UPI001BBA2978|nr:hypothetical protein [Shewanella sp. KT0246]GIU50275.1 hypothetical protein TUM4249_10130 [Shewanella sp. KT0246]